MAPLGMGNVVLGWGVGLLVGLLLAPLILQALWWVIAHQILGRLRDQGWISSRLKYATAFQVVLSLLIFLGLPLLLVLLVGWLALDPRGASSSVAQMLNFLIALPLFYGAYFVLIGGLWLQWLWSLLSRELFPRAVEEGVISSRLSYATGVLIMLLIVALYLLQFLVGLITTALSISKPSP